MWGILIALHAIKMAFGKKKNRLTKYFYQAAYPSLF
jgi:hypothetical protein